MPSRLSGKAAPSSIHFAFQEVADGAYAALANETGWAVGNAGVVDLGDTTLVFDTFSNHLAAMDLRQAAEAATGKPASIVINGHAHRDHVKGNQVFPDAAIVSPRKTAEAMTLNWKGRTERVRKEGLAPIRQDINAEFDAWVSHPLTTEADRVPWESYRQSLLQGIEDYHLRLPTVSFETSLRFHGSGGDADALTFGGGHSASDALLHVPERSVAFLGDLLFIGFHPFLGDGDPEVYLRILDRIESLDAKTLVPGHGPVGTQKDLQTMRDYVAALQLAVDRGRSSGGDPKRRADAPIPEQFASLHWRAFWQENVEFFLRRNEGSRGS